MISSRLSILAVIILLIVVLSTILYILRTAQTHTLREGFMSVSIPHDIPIDYREDVSEFIDSYSEIGNRLCPVQNVVVDGIAKTLAGPEGKPDMRQAQTRAKAMANGQLFDCVGFQKQLEIINKGDITMKDLYNIFDDIPDNVGYRMWNSAKFSYEQINNTYKTIQSTLSAAVTEGFATEGSPDRCKTKELCPDEMAKEIIKRLPSLRDGLTKAKQGFPIMVNPLQQQSLVGIDKYISDATDLKTKLDEIKSKAEAGTLMPTATEKPSA